MGRKEPAKGVHTSPEKAGRQNFEGLDMPKDDDNIMSKLMPIKYKGDENKKAYKGLWTEESLANSVNEFFQYCNEVSFKPTKPSLAIWLGVHRDTLHEWSTNPKHGYKTDIIKGAFGIMEAYLQANIDKYPTGSCFLLRTSHGHVETSKVDINNTNVNATADDINEIISKLGMDKQK